MNTNLQKEAAASEGRGKPIRTAFATCNKDRVKDGSLVRFAAPKSDGKYDAEIV